MKLSQITNTDDFLDKVCEVTPYVEKIIEDKQVSKVWKDKIKASGGEISREKLQEMALDKGLEKVFKFIPLLLKKHRESMYGILSVINEVSIDEIGKQEISVTISQVKELITDKEFLNLFL